MDVVRKDASIINTDDDFPGSFEVVLSAPTKDRDGDTLLPGEWKQPLPARIPFDTDHGMSVETTVGSGVPRLDPDTGNLVVSGTYSALPRAQEVRTLVSEGHVTHTSVAFMTEKTKKDGKSTSTRELLNGAFVNTPSNREAVILASKSVDMKSGARNAKADQVHIDAIAAHAVALGAHVPDDKSGGDSDGDEDVAAAKSVSRATLKSALDVFATLDITRLPAAAQRGIALVKAAAIDEFGDTVSTPEDTDSAAQAAAIVAPATPAAAEAAVEDDSQQKHLNDNRARVYRAQLERNQ